MNKKYRIMVTGARIRTSILLLLLLAAIACDKMDRELEYLKNSISIKTAVQVVSGDSLTVIGRIHIDRNPVISLGGVQADYVFKETSTGGAIDTVRFRVTQEMGIGRQALEVRSGEYNQVLYINILDRPELGEGTDTTLVVEELYNDGQALTYNITWGSVSSDGNLYLLGNNAIYHYFDGSFRTWLKTGDALTIDGQEVHVQEYRTSPVATPTTGIAGVATDPGHSAVYLSVYTDMTGHENFTGAWLLLKADPELGEIEIVNRTWHRTDRTVSGGQYVYTQVFFPSLQRDYGPVADIRTKGIELFADAQGRLLLKNDFASGNKYFARVETDGSISKITEVISNTNIAAYGYRGESIVVFGLSVNTVTSAIVYDTELLEPVSELAASQWFLHSYEEDPQWAFTSDTRAPTLSWNNTPPLVGMPGNIFLHLPDHSGSSSSRSNYTSIGALDPVNLGIYTYAGIEKGYGTLSATELQQVRAVQNQLAGPAKYVNFNNIGSGSDIDGPVRLLGVDGRNNVYFIRGGFKLSERPAPAPLRIYRLGKPAETTEEGL